MVRKIPVPTKRTMRGRPQMKSLIAVNISSICASMFSASKKIFPIIAMKNNQVYTNMSQIFTDNNGNIS